MWDLVFAELDALDLDVLRPSLPGHGVPPAPFPEGGFSGTVRELAGLIEPPHAPALVVGYSMGGRLALALALAYPERIHTAVVVGAHPGPRTEKEGRERAALDDARAARVLELGLPRFVAEWEKEPLFATQSRLPAEVLEAQRRDRLGHTEQGIARALRDLGPGRMPSQWDGLEMAGPVALHWVVGTEDPRSASIGGRARVHRVEGAGHNVVLEAPVALARIIEDACR
jgi:2-succinyl-6-hydroxy-2,4-cyclohexadiene-1-carboxylate synthase